MADDRSKAPENGRGMRRMAVGEETMKARLSALWVFAMLNYLYADVMSLMNAPTLKQFMAGQVGEIQVTPIFLLGAAFLMEIPIAMTLLSRVLPYRANRLANIIAGIFKTLVVLMSLFAGKPIPFYMVFTVCEIACTSFIVWYAWRWKKPDGDSAKYLIKGEKHGNESKHDREDTVPI